MLRYVQTCWMFRFIVGIGVIASISHLSFAPYCTQSLGLPATLIFFAYGCTDCASFLHLLFSCAGAGAGSGVQCRGGQPSFGFWPSGPGPGPAWVHLQWQGPQRLIRHCRPPLVRRRRVIPAHLITGHNATTSLPQCLTTACDRTVPNDHLYQHPTNMLIQVDNDDFCSACGGNGEIVCCDGCTRAFHQLCHDPFIPYSVLSDEDEEWYCWDCSIKRDPGLIKQHKGPWGPLMTALDKKHAVSYRLPKKTREYFEGVRTGPDGEYEDFVPQPKGVK